MPPSLSDNFPDLPSVGDDSGLMRLLVIMLGFILAQTFVLFLASCVACGSFGTRKTEPRHRAATKGERASAGFAFRKMKGGKTKALGDKRDWGEMDSALGEGLFQNTNR